MRNYFLLVIVSLFLVGCSTAPKEHDIPSSSKSANSNAGGMKIQTYAESLLGIPYKYGGATPRTGFDCSGFAMYVHKKNGITIPRVARDQFKSGQQIARYALQSGDLVFFETYRKGASHVGIYIGDNQFIHSPNRGKDIRTESLANSYFEPRYLGARRYW